MIEAKDDDFEAHSYLETLKENNFEWYKNAVYRYKDEYALPEAVIEEEESVASV